MKKLKSLFLMLLVSMVALTGCGKKNELAPTDAMTKAAENMQSLENYKMNVELKFNMSNGDDSIDVSLDADAVIDMKNKTGKMTMKAAAMDEDYDTEMYMDLSDDEATVYVKYDDEWMKTTSGDISLGDISADLDSSFEQFNIKELSPDKNNYNYEITISEDMIDALIDLVEDEIGDIQVDIKSIIKEIAVKISVDKATGNYSKISIDIADVLKKLMAKYPDETKGIKVKAAKFVITISDYNKAGSVTIPSSVIENAVSNDFDYDFDDDDYDYDFDDDDYDFDDDDDLI